MNVAEIKEWLPIIKDLAPWIGFLVAVALPYWQRRTAAHDELLKNRRHAVMAALEVIDHVHANTKFDLPQGIAEAPPDKWKLGDARRAMNEMLVYCADPERTVGIFMKAIGIWDPQTRAKPENIRTQDLNAFRDEVSTELELGKTRFAESELLWIYNLAGAE
jgi:hypothetical protein